ncbi:prohibitin family protein [Gangjinia marincola]|uniref:Prohibitin family protein n=1 Tax=Gangjinia marincola TaxID=578463 RepID=A0ABP3XQX1_9FLAO
MKQFALISSVVLISFTLLNCAVIRPGEAGVKQHLGQLQDDVKTEGTLVYNPFTSKVVKESIKINNLELSLNLPSKEGLSVDSQISILYRLKQDMIPSILRNIGQGYPEVITSVFRSAASDVCAQFFAKDMHSGMRANIEESIKSKMDETLAKQGILIEGVLMKSISLPRGLSTSIEQKLQAEQDAMRMEFVLQQEKLEAERKIISATGTRDAQKILAQGLTDQIIKIRSIEAFNKLSESSNAKIIITDGKTPLLINQ